jgi:hypothetical protein
MKSARVERLESAGMNLGCLMRTETRIPASHAGPSDYCYVYRHERRL